MKMFCTYHCLLFSVTLCWSVICDASSVIKATKSKLNHRNETKKTAPENTLDSRMNINYQGAHSQAYNGDSQSSSQSESGTWTTGIKGQDGSYTPLSSDSRNWGSSSANGYNAPNTWAQSNSDSWQSGASGSSSAGYSGGVGSADAEGFSVAGELPAGDMTLLSNLNLNSTKAALSNKTRHPGKSGQSN